MAREILGSFGLGVVERELAPGMERDKEGEGDLAGGGPGGARVGRVGRWGCLRITRGGVGAAAAEGREEEDGPRGPIGRCAACMIGGRRVETQVCKASDSP